MRVHWHRENMTALIRLRPRSGKSDGVPWRKLFTNPQLLLQHGTFQFVHLEATISPEV